ncbi:DUF3874 domain-containing protein [Edwardsiella anguillarum]|uniref:Uncharacterized protein n=1 Tax=Edwardsiella anguillarum ET080813 TaxID=667120 RepID=A0A076LM00_9GAMM|nr:Hypothetical protein ETEE_1266 [Edwardsiella anguillarum ET080813]BET82017.1 DUF3874 domain-containing protein [Edwardsiella anguillarum]BET85446.1 DUF3874 domain-containing protein [Edwardsiella anguillarum]BET88809.1 DUF3874 domain-containing protein [Edwardsiella anguillarum]
MKLTRGQREAWLTFIRECGMTQTVYPRKTEALFSSNPFVGGNGYKSSSNIMSVRDRINGGYELNLMS